MITIGKRIKARRLQLGLTQKDIEHITGIASGNLSNIENDKIAPSAHTIVSLSSVLQCTSDWILSGEKNTSDGDILDLLSDNEKELIELYRHFLKTYHADILAMVRDLSYDDINLLQALSILSRDEQLELLHYMEYKIYKKREKLSTSIDNEIVTAG